VNPNLVPARNVDLRPYQAKSEFAVMQPVAILCAPVLISNSPIMPAGFISYTDIIPSPLPVW
jgi:hypothetical protein